MYHQSISLNVTRVVKRVVFWRIRRQFSLLFTYLYHCYYKVYKVFTNIEFGLAR